MKSSGKQRRLQRRSRALRRRGAAVVEIALVLTAFITVTMGVLDLGVGVFRYHVLAEATRHGARQAIVHGERADLLVPWGPAPIDVTAAAAGTPIVDALQPMLVSFDLDQTMIQVRWPDGTNKVGKRVRVDITTPYTPIMRFMFGGTRDITASSTMRIAH